MSCGRFCDALSTGSVAELFKLLFTYVAVCTWLTVKCLIRPIRTTCSDGRGREFSFVTSKEISNRLGHGN